MLWVHSPEDEASLLLRNCQSSPITLSLEVSQPPSALLIASCPCPAVTTVSSSDPQPLSAQFSPFCSPYCFIQPCTPTSAVPDAQPLFVLPSTHHFGVFQFPSTSHRLSAQSFNTSGTSDFTKSLQPHAFHFQFHNFPLNSTSDSGLFPTWCLLPRQNPQHPTPPHTHSMSMSHPDPPAKGRGNRGNTFLLSWHHYRELF